MTTTSAGVTAGVLGGGVVVATSGLDWARDAAFNIAGNTIRGARTSAVSITQAGAASTGRLHGTVASNTIGGTGVDSCASSGGSGVVVRNRDGAGTLVAVVNANNLSQCSGPAISVRSSGAGRTETTVLNNVIGSANGAAAQQAFLGRFGVTDSANNACLAVGSTTHPSAPAGSITVQSNPTIATRLGAGYAGGSAAAYISSQNNGIPASATGAYTSGSCLTS